VPTPTDTGLRSSSTARRTEAEITSSDASAGSSTAAAASRPRYDKSTGDYRAFVEMAMIRRCLRRLDPSNRTWGASRSGVGHRHPAVGVSAVGLVT